MECWMLWHGGSSYAAPEIPRDLEHFDSLRAARDAFWRYGDQDPYRPCVIEDTPEMGGAEGWIFLYDPSEVADPYPDRILNYGPRGGVRLEYA